MKMRKYFTIGIILIALVLMTGKSIAPSAIHFKLELSLSKCVFVGQPAYWCVAKEWKVTDHNE